MRHIILLTITFIPLAFVFSPFFHDGFFPTMDDVQVVRIEEMYKELKSGQFPVRLVSDLGNGGGYMLFNFYSPLVYYIGAFFHFIGFTLVISTKLTFLSGFIIAWMGIYLLLREKFDSISIIFGSILFFSSSYLGYDVFHRGALAEFYALALLPLVFYTFVKLSKTPTFLYLIPAAVSLALLVITHNLTALITIPFLLFMIVLLFKNHYKFALGALLLGFILSSFYWLPVVFENQYIAINQIDFVINTYKNHFLSISQLIGLEQVPWGFRPPLLGISLFLGSLVTLFLAISKPRIPIIKDIQIDPFVLFSLISFFMSLLMASTLGKDLWEVVSPILRYIQFPWRFLTLATFFGAISCTFLLNQIKYSTLKIIIGLILIVPLFTLQLNYLRPTEYNYISKYTADDPCGTAGWSNEYIPIWAKSCLLKSDKLGPINILSGNTQTKNLKIEGHARSYTLQATGKVMLMFNKYYFPGWQAEIDNIPTPIKISSPNGLIVIEVPEGDHNISLTFKNTPVRSLSNLLSLGGIILIFLIILRYLKLQRQPKYTNLH